MFHDKTILTVLMQWDYGKPERGTSLDKVCFFDNLQKLVGRVEVLWFDDYLDKRDELQKLLLEQADNIKPDLVLFIPFTAQFTIGTLDELKQRYPTYAWFGDDQWRFESFSSKLASHFTHVSTTDYWSITKYEAIGIKPILTQWAAQPYTENIGPLKANESYEYEISFIGGRNRYREWFIEELEKNGIRVECFGAKWRNGRVSYEDMEQIFRKSKINLNISNSFGYDAQFLLSSMGNFLKHLRAKKNAEQIKARNFEIPLAGGFQLSNYVLGLERYLNIGQEIAVYNSVDDCVKQIHYYLGQEKERNQIIHQSHNRVITEHTYLHRLKHVLEEIWE